MIYIFLFLMLFNDPETDFKHYYDKCHDRLLTHSYILNPDSSIFFIEYAEQWKSSGWYIGKWYQDENFLLFKEDKLPLKKYIKDTVSNIAFLIFEEELDRWKTIKDEIIHSFEEDFLVKELSSSYPFDNYEPARQKELKNTFLQVKYNLARERVCGVDILIEVPEIKQELRSSKKRPKK